MNLTLDEAAVRAAFTLPDNDGAFKGDVGNYLRVLGQRKPVVMLAFPPKAAGTFLRTAAIEAIGGQLYRVVHAQGGRDAQPYLPSFIAYYLGGLGEAPLVTHIHMQALPANRHFVEGLDLKPCIMLRSIPDMIASYWDMLEKNAEACKEGLNCLIPSNFVTMTKHNKADFLIDILGPWYASYYATWLNYAVDEPDRILVLHFSAFLRDPAATLESVLRRAEVPRPYAVCRRAIETIWRERTAFRFNVGKEHRGKDYFTKTQIDRLFRMLSYYAVAGDAMDELLG